MAYFSSFLQNLESQPSDQTRGIDRNSNVGEGEEEEHNIIGDNALVTNGTTTHFFFSNGKDGEQEEIGYQRSSDEIHGKVESHIATRSAIVHSGWMLGWWYDAHCTNGVEA